MKPKLTKDTVIEFTNRDGHVIKLNANMTLEELMKMGVFNVRIVQPEVPLKQGEYRNKS